MLAAAGWINRVSAGRHSLLVAWTGPRDTLHIVLEAGLVERVAVEAFELDPARLAIPPLGALDVPGLRAAMLAVDAELMAGAAGSQLAAEALANVLAVQLIRQATSPRAPARRRDGALPHRELHDVIEYIQENLDANLMLEQMAAIANLSAYHFARRFKSATGITPHQYVISRRIERAQRLLEQDREGALTLSAIAVRAGFSDHSQFTNHFKRVVGVTPTEFRQSGRVA